MRSLGSNPLVPLTATRLPRLRLGKHEVSNTLTGNMCGATDHAPGVAEPCLCSLPRTRRYSRTSERKKENRKVLTKARFLFTCFCLCN